MKLFPSADGFNFFILQDDVTTGISIILVYIIIAALYQYYSY